MRTKFTQSFKIQAVEKALSRSDGVSLKQVAESLGVGYSTLERWIAQSRQQQLEPVDNLANTSHEQRPTDWSPEQRLNLIIACDSLDEEAISALCRQQGLYPHHVQQWRDAIVSNQTVHHQSKAQTEAKTLKQENKALKKELNRKEKALAETAALLVLQKKVQAIGGSSADDLQ